MDVNALDALTALSPGADLWILADIGHSRWTKKIDWYLNFQINRANPRMHASEPPRLSKELKRVMEETEFDGPEITVSVKAPLMISSQDLLPNRTTVVVPVDEHAADEALTDWVSRCHSVWIGLGRPKLRVFLPGRLSSKEAAKRADSDFIEAFGREWRRIEAADSEVRVECVTESDLDLLRS